MISALDDGIGNITKILQSTGLWDNTVIIFTSDNGAPSGGFNGTAMTNFPYKGEKGQLWEGGVHVPAFVGGGANIPFLTRGVKYDGLLHAMDLYPTIASGIANIPETSLPPNLDGYNVWNTLLNGGISPRTEALIHIEPIFNWTGIRSTDWKLLTGMPPGQYWGMMNDTEYVQHSSEILTNEQPILVQDLSIAADILTNETLLRVVPLTATTPIYLYNITADPIESNNVAKIYESVVTELLDRIAYYAQGAVPCRYPAPDPNGNPAENNRTYWFSWE